MMNTLHKSLTIAILVISIFIPGINVDLVDAQTAAEDAASTGHPVEFLQSKYLRFGRLTSKDGLSNVQTRSVAQDNQGFMWFGTANGLNRYDGTSIKVYRHDPADPYSLSNNYIRSLMVDRSGVIWIGTWGGGLNQYDREKDAFIRYQHDPNDPHSLSNNAVWAIFEGRDGTIWLGTHRGLNKFDRENKQFKRYLKNPNAPNSLSHDFVWSILEDSAGVLWVGTEGGLNRFDPKTEQFIHYRHDSDDAGSLSHDTIRSIYEDRSGILWLSTRKGLCKFNRSRTQITRYLHDSNNPQTLSNNLVTGAYEDRAGRLWVSTWGGGLNRFDRETETFVHFRNDSIDSYSLSSDTVVQIYEDQQSHLWLATDRGIDILDGGGKPFFHYRSISTIPNSLSHNEVRALYAGRSGIVWVGTAGGGFFKFDRQTETFTHYKHDPADPNSLSNNYVRAIYEDREGLIWIGTSGFALNRFDPKKKRFTHYPHDAANPRSISKGAIWYINEDRTGTLWIGTWGGGVNAFDRDSEQFTRYQHDPADPHTLSHQNAVTIFEDRAGDLWIGTIGGLNKFHRETNTFTRYNHVSTDPRSLVHNTVSSIYEDRTGTLWIGTLGGLDKFDRKNGLFTHYTTANGLSSNTIFGILEDEQGRLWLSTANGLSRFDPRTETLRNYYVDDGLQSNTFLGSSSHSKSRSGEMFFGGPNGLNAFYPEQIVDNTHPPPVLITDFQLARKLVPIGVQSVLKKSILKTEYLTLSYLDRVFSFEFAVLSYRAPHQNQYKYRLEGFEKEWNETNSTRRFATYTNLDPGDYVFRVIGSNNDGIWNEEGASIHITVTPPWWETMWFRISMVAASIALLLGVINWRVRNIEARRRKLEIQVQKRTQELAAAKEDALKARDDAEIANKAKSDFLANMSHELRTPLNAILGFSVMLAQEEDATPNQQEKLAIINRSGQHLLSMINDVLDLSKIEAERIELEEHPFDLVALIKEISVMIQSRPTEKGLSMAVEADSISVPYIRADMGKLRQILINLFGNAIKFTDEGGVTIRYQVDPILEAPKRCHIVIEVEDTGPGIEPARQAKIFEPFVQGITVPERKGTGLGLSICKKYADFMGGTIELESEVGKGSLFRVRLPAEIAEAADVKTPVDDRPRVIGLAPTQKALRILVADDNRANLILLKSLLEEVGFVVLEAENGKEAVEVFKKESPDLVWMDMRMPVMDGYEAVQQIRQFSGGDTIPIIAITASAFGEQQADILAAGCNDIIIKPFRTHQIFEAMGRFLDIEYFYKQEGETAPARMGGVDLTAEMLAELPPELNQELSQAVLQLDKEAIFAVIERIEPMSPDTAKGLRILLDNFQTGLIGELLGENDEK
jgi:signal transduction histidine kinase/CheY-like chemotaxis protein/streptogramin lyase